MTVMTLVSKIHIHVKVAKHVTDIYTHHSLQTLHTHRCKQADIGAEAYRET